MKKTLVLILTLAGGVACGLDERQILKDVTNVTSSSNSFDFTSNHSKAVTIALTLDVTAYKNITDNQNLFKLNGTWEDELDGYLGISSIVGGNNPVKDGIQSAWQYGQAQNKNSDIKQYTCFSDVNWTQVVDMTMVMSYAEGSDNNTPDNTTDDKQMPFNTAISMLLTDGTVVTWAEEKNDLFIFTVSENNITTGKTNGFIATNVTANATYVDSLTVYSGYLTINDSITLSKERLIPEPTTATLSLLALAGLAARRRRK